ncbi:MAG: molybdopterin-binding protein [Chloroflexi bacterium]|jgi:nicotinamide-nucleotide amidase|nr:molybdopterin-binding protein [Chloroflexota bacterium]
MPEDHRQSPARPLRSAELLAVGSELTNGETRDTNGGELAAALAAEGVSVRRISALPDDLAAVTAAFRGALAAADVVVATGGLGPTPDDLTREAVAAVVGEVPAVDPGLEAWLRGLFEKRGMPLLAVNLKQAWLIPSSTSIPNANGTAPGWWVDRPDGRVVILLPGPPREMRPMWASWVLPRLRERGLGDGRLARTLRLYGIGESVVADRLGDAMLRRANPVVATYARADWLDVRISAVDEPDPAGGPPVPARTILDETTEAVRAALAEHVRTEGETGWADLVAGAAAAADVRIATFEIGTRGALAALLASVPAVERSVVSGGAREADPASFPVEDEAAHAARDAGVAVGCAVAARTDASHTVLRVAVSIAGEAEPSVMDLRLFQHGEHGLFRAAVATAAFLLDVLESRSGDPGPP